MKLLAWSLKWMLAGLVAVFIVALGFLARPQYRGPTKTGTAQLQAKRIIEACEAYRDFPENPNRGQYPRSLGELVHPPFGGVGFLKYGEADLVDPWGNAFRYALEANENGETEVRVWSARIVDGRQKVIGARRKANGVVEAFESEE